MQSQKEDEVKKVHLLRELESMLVQEHDRTADQEERFSELLQSLDLEDIEKLSRKYRPDTHAAPQDTQEDEAIALALSKMDGALWGAEQELEQERMRERELQRVATHPSTDHSIPSAASRARAVQMDEQGVCHHDTELFKKFFQQLQLPMALFPPVSIAHTPTLENQQFSRSTTMPAQERERVRDRVCERDSGPHPWPLHPLQEQNFRERTPTPTPSQRDTDSEFAKQLQEEEMRAHGISFGDLKKFQEIAQNQDIFSSKTMLYVPACFAGKEVELFVDTGAQSSVISECMVREMNLSNKINRFYRGQATGVGTASITGLLLDVPVQVGSAGVEFKMAFLVLATEQPLLIMGLDQMRKYKCLVDLERNELVFGGHGGNNAFYLAHDGITCTLPNAGIAVKFVDRPISNYLPKSQDCCVS